MKIKKEILKTKSNSYTDKLFRCKTWEEVIELKDCDDIKWKTKLIFNDSEWINSFSNEESIWSEQYIKKSNYDELLDEITILLKEEELNIFLLTYQGNGSLRWVANQIGKSHEYTRKKLKDILLILQTNLPIRFRTLL